MGAVLSVATSVGPVVLIACAFGAAYIFVNMSQSEVTPLNRPSPGLPDPRSKPVEGEPGARMSALVDKLIAYTNEDTRTLYDAVQRGCRESNNGDCLGTRSGDTYSYVPYQQIIDRSHHTGSGLINLGAKPGQDTKIGIYSQNRIEYMLTEIGCYAYSMILVPLYDTLGEEAVNYVIDHTDIEYVVVDKEAKISLLLKQPSAQLLKAIICMESVSEEIKTQLDSANIELLSFADLEKRGRENEQPLQKPTAEDVCVICYTSGTTGLPKGVVSTHGNYIAVVNCTDRFIKWSSGDTYLSYLPLAHCYERFAMFTTLNAGGRVAFFGGDVRKLLEDIQAAKPTTFCAVPRLLNKIYDKVHAGVQSSGFIKRKLFEFAYSSKLKALNQGSLKNNTIWDKLVFKKISALLGGQCKYITTGSAPISLAVMDFIRISTGALVMEGYGQTENAAAASCQLLGETRAGNVGPPTPCGMIKLVDVPEMNYSTANNQGEVCIKGHHVFKGYYKDEEKTAEALDEDGWLHTGDIGQWTEDWSLKIIDRKKNIFKLSQGEYIAPEKIENFYIRSAAIAQIFVYGESLKSCLVAIAFADPENIQAWAKSKVGVSGSVEEVCKNEAVQKAVFDDLTSIGKEAGLKSFEQVRKIHLHPEIMTPENGLLTPTQKAKRPQIRDHFKAEIEKMYEGLD